jgi:hypothetical protein
VNRQGCPLDAYRVPPCNWDFYQRSSWVNFYLGRDHSAKRFGIETVLKNFIVDKGKSCEIGR